MEEGYAEMRRLNKELRQLKSQTRIAKLSQLMPSADELPTALFSQKSDSKQSLQSKVNQIKQQKGYTSAIGKLLSCDSPTSIISRRARDR